MQSFFHLGLNDRILFENWIPNTHWEYALTWIGVFIFAILIDGLLLTLHARLDAYWKHIASQPHPHERAEMSLKMTDGQGIYNILDEQITEEIGIKTEGHIVSGQGKLLFRWSTELARASFMFIHTMGSMGLMLVAMTYDVGLFFAVGGGAFVGTLIFGRWR